MKATNFDIFAGKLSKAALLLALLGLLTACGAQSTPRAAANSYAPTIDFPSTTTTGAPGAECNYFDSSSIRLQGKVTTFYLNGTMQEDRIRLRITGLDSKFDNNENLVIKFFRWKASDTGTTEIDSAPLDFVVHNGVSGAAPLAQSMQSINIRNVATMRQAGGVAGTTALEFFNNTNFVITGVDYNWDALKVVIYDGTTVLGQADFLLPVFAANPNTYATDHPGVLENLHPFWSQRTQSNMTDTSWVQRTASYCF